MIKEALKGKMIVPQEIVESKIFFMRGRKVMIDRDLSTLYKVKTKIMNQAVKRNIERFPKDCVPRTYIERRFSLSSMVLCER